MIRQYFDGDTFERNGRTFIVTMPNDDSGDAPWERSDCHGIVSDWRYDGGWRSENTTKKPGERELCRDRGQARYYDFAGTIAKAKKEGWGLCEEDRLALQRRLKQKPSQKQIIAQAVENDFEYLRRWCTDQWSYIGVVVSLDDGAERDVDHVASLWGIESDADDYIVETAHALADEINATLDDEMAAEIEASRPDMVPS